MEKELAMIISAMIQSVPQVQDPIERQQMGENLVDALLVIQEEWPNLASLEKKELECTRKSLQKIYPKEKP
ncbi:MAG: hypothetical protein K2I72_01135 [Bacilli bacterium]|nr:hypothetical protein [Bacilli bacterium]